MAQYNIIITINMIGNQARKVIGSLLGNFGGVGLSITPPHIVIQIDLHVLRNHHNHEDYKSL